MLKEMGTQRRRTQGTSHTHTQSQTGFHQETSGDPRLGPHIAKPGRPLSE